MEEIWKCIPGFDGYQASNLGRIKNSRTNSPTFGTKNNRGYMSVYIKKNNKYGLYQVHRLILFAFTENSETKNICDHIDRNPLNNNIKNLRWVTHNENQLNRNNYGNSLFKGVSKCTTTYTRKDGSKGKSIVIRAQITINGERMHLGSFNTEEEAHEAYKQAFKKHYGYEWMG